MKFCPKSPKPAIKFFLVLAFIWRLSPVPEPARWRPENPHPLFGRKIELVWDGKYDEYGARRPVDIAGSGMAMREIETKGHE